LGARESRRGEEKTQKQKQKQKQTQKKKTKGEGKGVCCRLSSSNNIE